MFVNEYRMDRKRYDRWAAPKCWRLPTFYLYCLIFAAGVFGWIYFDRADVPAKWKTIGAFLTFVAVYRGVFFHWMQADKMFRLMRSRCFDGKDWLCKVVIGNNNIALYINGKINHRVEWKEIQRFEEAKSYYKLATAERQDGVVLDKQCFTKGDAVKFKHWMTEQHPEIKYGRIHPAYDR